MAARRAARHVTHLSTRLEQPSAASPDPPTPPAARTPVPPSPQVWELHRAHSTEAAASQRTRNWEDPLPGENEQVDADSLVAVIARR